MKETAPTTMTGSLCPVDRDATVRARYEEAVKHIRTFARSLVAYGEKLPSTEREKELHAASETSRLIFQKWTLEILYTLGVSRVLRFGALKASLPGISSRTLSLKLDELERLGFVNRKLYDERPIRVEYSLTEKGLTLAAITTPLVAYLFRELQPRVAERSAAEAEVPSPTA